ncbi:MAG: hypothetical protein PHV55_03755, partial [Candidatus Omnitrophica bacterium]|nr:hypothetical protein [Candidatus Omnitrophota bacterium]
MKRTLIIGLVIVLTIGLIIVIAIFSKNTKLGTAMSAQTAEAEVALAKGDLAAAKAIYKKAMEDSEDADTLQSLQKKVEDINIKILFSPTIDSCSVKYTVKP